MKHKFFSISSAYLFFSLFVCSGCWADTAVEHVRTMLDRVMSIQTDPVLKSEGCREKRRIAIKRIIKENFDFDKMAEMALGQFKKEIDETRYAEFRDIFQDLFQDSYTKMVLDFLRKEEIHYTKGDAAPGNALVKTNIVRINDEIPVDYFLVPVQKGWLIYDVKIDDVSIVRNYARSFKRVIKKESFDALMRKMQLQWQAVNNSE